jgi:hypothetical protein
MGSFLDLTEKARVLQAALSLPTFTAEELAEFSGVKRETVQTTLGRVPGLIERVGKEESTGPGGRRIRYHLRSDARETLARESVRLARALSAGSASTEPQTGERVKAVLDALESSLAFARDPEGSGEEASDWSRRAQRQAELAGKLIALIPPGSARDDHQTRLDRLRDRLRSAGAPNRPDLLSQWRRFVRRAAGARGAVPITDSFTPELRTAAVSLAPAALVSTIHDQRLSNALTAKLREAERPYLQIELMDRFVGADPVVMKIVGALEISPHDTALIVTLDSTDPQSEARVTELMRGLRNYLWLKGAAKPIQMPEITLIDRGGSSKLLRANQVVRNLSYVKLDSLATASDSGMERVAAAVVRNTVEDVKELF